MLYADDTILLAESPEQLQVALNGMFDYCTDNKLCINEKKTKCMVFSKGKIRNLPSFTYNNEHLEVVHSYSYLGITFNYNGKFIVAQRDLYDKASRAMFGLLAKCRRLRLPIDVQIKLFDCTVKPIIMYGSEVWGFHTNDIVQSI